MSASIDRRLRELDRALIALAEERLRLRTLAERLGVHTSPALEDLLRRHDGELTAERVRALCAALDELTAPPGTSRAAVPPAAQEPP